ncbi:MAG: hypothetical protein IJ165_12590 [Proteobacteria bacterium]|nr:hypothetical protein [Pseudomonadota bacterium]
MKRTFTILFSLCALSLLNGCDDYLTFVIEEPSEEVIIEVECNYEKEIRYAPNSNGFCEKQVCQDNKWTTQDSCGNVSCKTEQLNVNGLTVETLQCGECISGTTEYDIFEQCQKRTCTNGKWSAYSNEPDVSKCGTCNDGESKYQNELEDNKLICKKYDCIQGKYQADNSFKNICQNSCNNLSNGCGACINDYARARENDKNICITEICKNGAWKEEDNTCTASCTSISAENGEPQDNLTETCGECINNQVYYKNDEDNICKKYSCQSGKLTLEDFECEHSCDTNKANSSESGCGVCKNGDVRFDNDEHGICKRSICKDGNWTVDNFYNCTKSCLNEDNSEDQSDQCGQCVNSQAEFVNDEDNICYKQECNKGIFIESTDFVCSNSCSETGCGDCINDNQRCNGNTIETCVDGKFQKTKTCDNECIENEFSASCKAACDQDGVKCYNSNNIGILSTCNNGDASEATCPGNVLCKSETECGECQYGESFCENSQIKTCMNGKWSIEPCPDNKSCSNSNQCGECQDGQEKYSDLPNQNCQKYRCIQGRWESQELCKNNVSCTDNGCGSCTNYTFSTDDKDLQTCINGKRESNGECLRPPFTSERFIYLGEYIACNYHKILGISSNENDKVNCYNKKEGDKHIGFNRSNNTPCNENTPVSCHVIGVNQTACGECLELDTRCDGQTPQTCINGKWTTDLPEWHTADRCKNN